MTKIPAKEKASGKKDAVQSKLRNRNLLRVIGLVATLGGIGLFAYVSYSVGIHQILDSASQIGLYGFVVLLGIYFVRICIRGIAWKLTVYEPYSIRLQDTIPAVIIGEALSSMIPLGILISGTAKAFAVRKKLPLVVGLSSVATENLFYSLATGLFISLGVVGFLRSFELPQLWRILLDVTVVTILSLIGIGILLIIRQWHFVSYLCDELYDRGFFKRTLDSGRLQVRLFENLIFGFYRRHPWRFIPIFLLQVAFQLLGVFEVWYVLTKLNIVVEKLAASFYLETVNRLIGLVFKFIPFVIGVDEAGAELVMQTLGLSVTVGVTVAIVRKGRTIFWAAIGVLLIVRRGFNVKQLREFAENVRKNGV